MPRLSYIMCWPIFLNVRIIGGQHSSLMHLALWIVSAFFKFKRGSRNLRRGGGGGGGGSRSI